MSHMVETIIGTTTRNSPPMCRIYRLTTSLCILCSFRSESTPIRCIHLIHTTAPMRTVLQITFSPARTGCARGSSPMRFPPQAVLLTSPSCFRCLEFRSSGGLRIALGVFYLTQKLSVAKAIYIILRNIQLRGVGVLWQLIAEITAAVQAPRRMRRSWRLCEEGRACHPSTRQ